MKMTLDNTLRGNTENTPLMVTTLIEKLHLLVRRKSVFMKTLSTYWLLERKTCDKLWWHRTLLKPRMDVRRWWMWGDENGERARSPPRHLDRINNALRSYLQQKKTSYTHSVHGAVCCLKSQQKWAIRSRSNRTVSLQLWAPVAQVKHKPSDWLFAGRCTFFPVPPVCCFHWDSLYDEAEQPGSASQRNTMQLPSDGSSREI